MGHNGIYNPRSHSEENDTFKTCGERMWYRHLLLPTQKPPSGGWLRSPHRSFLATWGGYRALGLPHQGGPCLHAIGHPLHPSVFGCRERTQAHQPLWPPTSKLMLGISCSQHLNLGSLELVWAASSWAFVEENHGLHVIPSGTKGWSNMQFLDAEHIYITKASVS